MKNRRTDKMEGIALILKGGLFLLLLSVLFLTGCGGEKEQVGDPVQAYMTVIKSLEDPERFRQESDMAYIAVDTRHMTGIQKKEEKKRFLSAMEEAYGIEILDRNQVQLARDGYLTDNTFLDGVLFQLNEADYSTYEKSPVLIRVTEWGRGTETMLRRQFTLEAEDGGWKITDVEEVTEKEIR